MSATEVATEVSGPASVPDLAQGGPSEQPATPAPTGAFLKSQMRNVCFTLNNYTAEQFEALKALECKYIVMGEEIAKTGTHHLQGYVEFKSPMRVETILKRLFKAHIEKRRGTAQQAADYCKKDGKVFEKGTISHQGSRFASIVADLIDHHDMKEIVTDYPEEFIKFHAGIERVQSIVADQTAEIAAVYEGVVWKPWQQKIVDLIATKPHDRKVYWFVDKLGGTGKTYLAKYLMTQCGAAYFNNAKTADIACAYNGERVCIFDLARSNLERVNYQIIEQVKNGVVFSAKYASRSKAYAIPHVIVFANFPPDLSKLSADRWCISTVPSGPKFHPSDPAVAGASSEPNGIDEDHFEE